MSNCFEMGNGEQNRLSKFYKKIGPSLIISISIHDIIKEISSLCRFIKITNQWKFTYISDIVSIILSNSYKSGISISILFFIIS